MEQNGTQVERRAAEAAGRDAAAERRRVAGLLREQAEAVTRSGVQNLGYWLRPPDIGPDQLSEWLGGGFGQLAANLALALELDQPGLLTDEIAWLAQMLHHRGYDAATLVRQTLDTFEASLAAVCPPEVPAAAAPLLAAARTRLAETVAALPPRA
jgi:hypothetical protein